MRWYDDLYVGYNLLDKKRQVMWKIKRGKQQFNKYVITLPFNDYDVLAGVSLRLPDSCLLCFFVAQRAGY